MTAKFIWISQAMRAGVQKYGGHPCLCPACKPPVRALAGAAGMSVFQHYNLLETVNTRGSTNPGIKAAYAWLSGAQYSRMATTNSMGVRMPAVKAGTKTQRGY